MSRHDVVEWLVKEAPAIMDSCYGPRRCIAATKHGLAVCRYFGVPARPQKVTAVAGNQEFQDWMEAGMSGPQPDTSWAVAIDIHSQDGPGYPGHLVIVATEEDGGEVLVDLDLGQFSRPHRDMPLPAAGSFFLPEDFYEKGASYMLDETMLVYLPLSERDWHSSPDWKRSPPLAGRMIRELKAAALV